MLTSNPTQTSEPEQKIVISALDSDSFIIYPPLYRLSALGYILRSNTGIFCRVNKIKEGVKKEEADEIKQKVEAVGATVEVK